MPSQRNVRVFALILAICGPPQVIPADSPGAPSVARQIYDKAQAAFDRADWTAAITGLSLLVAPDNGGKMSHSQGIIHSRLAQAYAHDRKAGSALREAALALKGLTSDDSVECALIWIAIGEAQRFDLEVPSAIDSYEQGLKAALDAKNAVLATSADVGLALCYMTVDREKAVKLLDAVLTAPETASTSALLRSQLYDLRGRASLNLGRADDAMPFLRKAIKLSGGLQGSQINLAQVSIRGDAAIGAILDSDDADAREYLNWTGAGHLPSEEWTRDLGDPPLCGEAAGIRPNDMVVVEFSVATDGSVAGAAPIYASRPGTLGIDFAKAVKEWRWNPERIADLPPFWRNMVRIEMRCITRPSPHSLAERFTRETFEWLTQIHAIPEDLASHTLSFVAADDPRLDRDDVSAIPALFARLPMEKD